LTKKKLKKLKQLEKVCELYDCKIRCLSAVTFIVENNVEDQNAIDSFFDCSKTCSNTSIREFICEIVPQINNCCVCEDLEQKIKTLSIISKTQA